MIRQTVIGAVKLYRRLVSPFLPRSCRFYPTCSQYCIEAVEKHGTARGLLMSLLRVLRCNQFHKGGFDPVR